MGEIKFNIDKNDYLPLRDVVFKTLRDAILNSDLEPGERLLENKLADELGVSRTPIREALRMLELENLVELIPRRGAQVLGVSKSDVMHILEIRTALEGLATTLACKRISTYGLGGLRAAGDIFEEAVASGDRNRIIEADESFHDIIFASTENPRLIQMYENLRVQLYRYRMAHVKLEQSVSVVLDHHREILKAIEDGDVEKGRLSAEEHIKYHEEFILKAMHGVIDDDEYDNKYEDDNEYENEEDEDSED